MTHPTINTSYEEGSGRAPRPRRRDFTVGDPLFAKDLATNSHAKHGSDALLEAMMRAYRARAARDGISLEEAATLMLSRGE
jgi:hypothetical protein